MQFQITAIGNKMPDWVDAGVNEYAKRFHHPFQLTLKALPMEKRQKNADIAKLKQKESDSLRSAATGMVIALDETGKSYSTLQLADQIKHWQRLASRASFLIGGPDGIDKPYLQQADEVISLSQLTLPHPLVRIILVEQLYRAVSILQHHPYHRS